MKYIIVRYQYRKIVPKTRILVLLFLGGVLFSCSTTSNVVNSIEEFNDQVATAQPGDSIVLANGVWNDVELLFVANGTVDAPIKLTVETKGKVSLEGQSNIRIGGSYLIVEGLVFKNGYTPTSEVISFKKDKKTLSHNSRVTECVIDNYNNPERFESDYWVGI